ncbi:carbohydrate-binding protein [Streptomyces ferrugineus]|uniref:Carbohydrate-binding protein n=1 Tax=Streptomyces ferrugineus TaxID=1413221 RepID=A0A7M2SML4_9ACTN|nr:CBM35 domain-containing protein [Streptomyces ferrugineus]QOV37504.1 carbohydrate-binding protein [Streptomyces ferrugineus]
MTSGNNGANTPPEDDDPFGYLYADGQANGAQPPSGGYGYPNAVNRVRAVGQRQYGQPPAAPQIPQQGAYGQPNAHYAAPETLPGGAPTTQQPSYSGGSGRGAGRGGGPNTKGLLIGAIAVVAAVVIGIGVAMLGGDEDPGDKDNEAGATPSQSQSAESSPSASSSAGASEEDLQATDAKTLRLEGGATTDSAFKGARADGGIYVTNFNKVGAKVTWTVNGIDEAGPYTLNVRYSSAGKDANATLLVNGTANSAPLGLKNFIGARAPEGDWEKGWQTTWAPVTLNKGTNTLAVACNDGNKCDAILDQMWLTKGTKS